MIDIYDIQRYTSYETDLSITAEQLMKQVTMQAEKYLTSTEIDQIWSAFEFAKQAHEWVLRLSGEQYIIHPVYATIHLMMIRPDCATIQACLMHDVIEDTDYTQADIAAEFGDEVAKLCQSMVKVGKIKYRGEQRNLETWKKTFLAMAEDLRVIFIKLADRIHNTQTLKYHPEPTKVARIAQETLEIHASIAKRLWLHDFQLLLENGAYAMLEPEKFAYVMKHMLEFYASDQNYVQTGIDKLTAVLHNDSIEFDTIKGRMKSPYRVAQKVFDPSKPYDIYTIHDVVAFRILVLSLSDCYLVLGAVHGAYTPELAKIKDFIARPLTNGYQSLHTRVFGLLPFQTEVQIRTHEMDQLAEYGVAAHFAYSESGSKSIKTHVRQSEWIHKMQDIVKQYQEDFDGFKHEMSMELVDTNIFVYTPKWDVIELPTESSILDFAFKIHSWVWLSYRNGMVNGSIVPIDYHLKSGDVVQIVTRNNKEVCTPTWLNYVSTAQAKQAINKYLRAAHKPALIKSAIDQVNHKLIEYDLPIIGHPDSEITKQQTPEQLEGTLIQIFEKQITPYHLIKQYYPHIQQHNHQAPVVEKVWHIQSHTIMIDGSTQLEYSLCGECSPIAWQTIIAKSSVHGIKIHEINCASLTQISYDRLLECHRWDDARETTQYQVSFDIQLHHQQGQLIQILNIFRQLSIDIASVKFDHTSPTASSGTIVWVFTIPSKIHYTLNQLNKIPQLAISQIHLS